MPYSKEIQDALGGQKVPNDGTGLDLKSPIGNGY